MAIEDKKAQDNNNLSDAGASKTASGTATSQSAGQPQASGTAPAAASGAAKPADSRANNANYEGGAISAKLPVIALTPHNESVTKLVNRLKEDELIRAVEATVSGTPILARQLRPCIVIASIAQNNDVVKYLNMLKPLKDDLKTNRIKFIVLSKINNPAIIAMFERAGCNEYIIEPINERSLQFKVNLQTKALKAQRKKLRQEELRAVDDAKKGDKTPDAKKAQTYDEVAEETDKNIKAEEGNEDKDDVWVFRGNKPKKAGGKWTMRMKGPDPSKGEWKPAEKGPDGQTQWRFMEKDEDPNNPKPKKGWEFAGDKPTFSGGEWNFNSEKPELSLIDEKGNKQFSKIKTDGKEGLVMAKDSEVALKKDEEREKQAEVDKDKKKKALFSGTAEDKGEQGEFNDKTGANSKGAKVTEEEAKKKGLNFSDFAMADTDEPGKINDKTGGPEKKAGGAGLGLGAGNEKENKLKDFAKEAQTKSEEKNNKDGAKEKEKDKAREKPKSPWLKGKDAGKDAGDKAASFGSAADDESAEALGTNKKNFLKKKDGPEDDPKAAAEDGTAGKDRALTADGAAAAGGRGIAQGTGAIGKGAKPGEPDSKGKKGRLDELAGMAMNFDEEKTAPNNKLTTEEAKGITGKDEAKTEHIKNSKWGGHDLTPSEMLKREEREKRQLALKDSLAKRTEPGKVSAEKADGASIDVPEGIDTEAAKNAAAAGQNGDKAGALGAGKKNFLKKDKDEKGAFNDKSGTEAEVQGGWSKHRDEEEKKKRKMNAHDSDQSGPVGDDRDQMVEIDQPKGTLTHNMMGDKVWEYPPDFFGSVNGTWEGAGNDNSDEQKRKCFVFLEPEIRMKKVDDVRTIKTWWIFHGDRPLFNVHKKVWFCKKYEPRKYVAFDKLPQVAQDFLLSVSPHVVMQKKKELEEKIKKTREGQAEQVKKAREEFKEKKVAEEEKKKVAEEEKKSAMEALRGLDAKDEKGAGKQSHKYENEEAKKKDKNKNESDEKKAEAAFGKQKLDGEQSDKESLDAKSKDEKGKKKKARLEAELDIKGNEKDAKSKDGKQEASEKEKIGELGGEKKKREKLEATLELDGLAKKDDKGKQSLDKAGGGEGDEKLGWEKGEKKEQEDNSGSQKLEKQADEKAFKGGKSSHKDDAGDGKKDSQKHSHKHNKFEAEMEIQKDDSAGAKKNLHDAHETESVNKTIDKKKDQNRQKHDATLEIPDDGSGKSSHKNVASKEDSAKSTYDKSVADDQKLGKQDEDGEGEESQKLSPLDEALRDTAVIPLPSAPMMAVYVSELLISKRGDAIRVLDKFVHFLSQGCSGVGVTVFYLGQTSGELVVKVMASSHPHYPVGSQLSLTERPDFKQAIETGVPCYPSPDGPLHVPINPSKAVGQMPVGMLLLEPLGSGMRFTKLVQYFRGVAQCLRGVVVRASAQSEPVKEAA